MTSGPERLVIGLTGPMGSGKGEVIKILNGMGFAVVSLSDMVREEISRMGLRLDRSQMQDVGNRMRREGGAGVLGARVREKILGEPPMRWVVDGIRNPAEIDELRRISPFLLLAVDCDREVILDRIVSRQRDTDRADRQELARRLEREWGTGEPPEGQQVGRCMALADVRVTNDATLADLQRQVTEKVGGWIDGAEK